jgi:hypothetical protein
MSGENTYAVAVCAGGCGEPWACSEAARIEAATSVCSFELGFAQHAVGHEPAREHAQAVGFGLDVAHRLGLYLLVVAHERE